MPDGPVRRMHVKPLHSAQSVYHSRPSNVSRELQAPRRAFQLSWAMARLVITVLVAIGCIALPPFTLRAQQAAPANLDFESGAPGDLPKPWILAVAQPQPGITARIVNDEFQQGTQAVTLIREATAAAGSSLNLLQQVDATPYRGRRVRFRMAVKAENASSPVHMWMRVEGPAPAGGTPPSLFLDNMEDRPITATGWRHYEIVTDVPPAAARIAFGAYLVGVGRAWLDDAVFAAIPKPDVPAPEAPREVTRRGLVNLMAFARLVGYVRHFHPSDEAAATDWDSFTIAGIRLVESAPDGEVLTQRLANHFRSIAPTVVVVPSGTAEPKTGPAEEPPARMLTWTHRGFGLSTAQTTYHSERAAAPQLSPPFRAELGGGVAVRVPLTVAADDAGTVPRGAAPAPPVSPPLTRGRFPVTDRATRLAAIILAWNVFQHSYPYFEPTQTGWSTALSAALQEAATDQNEREFVATLRRMIAGLRDGQARVTSPAEADLQFTPPLSLDWIENKLVVTSAEASTGVVPGDAVVAVEGTPAPLMLDTAEAFISAATPQWRRARAMQEILLGPKGAPVKLRIEKLAEPAQIVDVSLPRSATGYAPAPRLDVVAEVQPGILYVDVARITPAAYREALPRLEVAKGIIFDLRVYPAYLGPDAFFAHLSDKPVTSPQWHVPQIARPDREQTTFVRTGEWTIAPQAPFLAARKIFLADARGISYIESCLAIVEAHKLGEILGTPTAGTNGTVNRFQLPGDYTVFFTGTKVLKHDGSAHHGVGITPNIPVERTRAGVTAGRDELLERAVQQLSMP